jgi:hypothetical protein
MRDFKGLLGGVGPIRWPPRPYGVVAKDRKMARAAKANARVVIIPVIPLEPVTANDDHCERNYSAHKHHPIDG